MTEDRLPLAELLQKAGDGRLPARRRRGGAAAADGERRGGPDRRRAVRAQRGAADLPQRLPRARARHPARHAPAAGAEAAPGLLLPALPRAQEGEREGARGRHPGGVDRRGLDPARGRSRAGHGALGHLEEHGLQAVQGHRRARERLPRPPAGGGVAVPLAGRDLPEGQGGRPDRVGGGDNRRGGRHRGAARDRRPAPRPVRGRDLLGHVPEEPGQARPQGREARDLGRPRGPQGRDPARAGRHLAALPSPLDEERLGARGQGPAGGGRRRAPPGVPAGRRGAPRTRSGGRWPTSSGRAGRSSRR